MLRPLSESGIADISEWVISQGEGFYLSSTETWSYRIAEVFWEMALRQRG